MKLISNGEDIGIPFLKIYALHFLVILPTVTFTPGITDYFFFNFIVYISATSHFPLSTPFIVLNFLLNEVSLISFNRL